MPTVELSIPVSDTPAKVIVWVCGICGHPSEYIHTAPTPIDHKSLLEQLGWATLGDDEVFCDRCRHLPDIANLILARAKRGAL